MLGVFVILKHHPVIKASSRGLSCILLVGIMISFAESFVDLMEPRNVSMFILSGFCFIVKSNTKFSVRVGIRVRRANLKCWNEMLLPNSINFMHNKFSLWWGSFSNCYNYTNINLSRSLGNWLYRFDVSVCCICQIVPYNAGQDNHKLIVPDNLIEYVYVLSLDKRVCSLRGYTCLGHVTCYAVMTSKVLRVNRLFNSSLRKTLNPTFVSTRSQLGFIGFILGIALLFSTIWGFFT